MQALARTLSILGHPVVVLPLALWLATARGSADTRTFGGLAGFGALVLAWSWWQVRRGRWAHVDASGKDERRSLNAFLLVLFAAGAAVAWRLAPREVAWAIAWSLPIIALAMLSARWCKLSLHVAFAVYAALLLWRLGTWASLAGLCFAALLAWSRLALARHAPRDLIAGAAAGALSGAMYWLVPLAQGAR
jgi:membrane-associated phospholipid phosphatase